MKVTKTIINDFKNYSNSDRVNIFNIGIAALLNANFRAVLLYRISHYFDKNKIFILAYIFEKIMHITTITWIGRRAVIGDGFVIRHIGAIVIGGKTVIGKNCEIRQGVTFGGNMGKFRYGTTQPILGNNILIGAGAKILGPIKIGDNSIIGANAVVITDVPANSVYGGVPAKFIREVNPGENPLNK